MQQDKHHDEQRHGSGTRTAPRGPRRMTAAMAMDMSDEAHSNQQHQQPPGSYSQVQQRYENRNNRNRPPEYQPSQRYHGYSDNESIPSYVSRSRSPDPYYGERHNVRSRSPIREHSGRDSDGDSYAQRYDSASFVHPVLSHESGNNTGQTQGRAGVDPSQNRAQEAFQQRFAAIYQQTRAAAMQCIQQRMIGVGPNRANFGGNQTNFSGGSNPQNFGFPSGLPPFPPMPPPYFPNPREQQITRDGITRSGRSGGYRDETPSMSVWRAKRPSQPAASSQGGASSQITETPTMSVWKAPKSPPIGGTCTLDEKDEHAPEASTDEGSDTSGQERKISAMPVKVDDGYRTDLPTMSVWRATKPSDSAGRSNSSGQKSSPSASSSTPVRLPSDVSVAEYARRRAQEIESLTQNILASRMRANMQAFQTLPRHMRRRAASYDTRRLPRRLRNLQQSQVGP